MLPSNRAYVLLIEYNNNGGFPSSVSMVGFLAVSVAVDERM